MGVVTSIGKGLFYTGGAVGLGYGAMHADAGGASLSGIAGSAVGAGILTGAGTAAAVGTAALGAYGAFKATQFAIPHIGAGAVSGAKNLGEAVPGMLERLGVGTANVARALVNPYQFSGNNPLGRFANAALNPLGTIGKITGNVIKNSVERAPSSYSFKNGEFIKKGGGIRMTNLGRGIIGAGVVAGAIGGIRDALVESRMGALDPNVVTSTSMYMPDPKPAQTSDAGATGDLVFALHGNRR